MAFIQEYKNHYEVRIIDDVNNTFHKHMQSKNARFPFGKPFDSSIEDMGYKSAKECIKNLKSRGLLGEEIALNELKEIERMGCIQLGVERLNRAGVCDCSKIIDVCENLARYGMNYIDAQEQIIAMYEIET